MSDLRNYPEVSSGKTKQRVYDEQRQFVGNYKTVVCKGAALQMGIIEDLEDGLASGTFAESELMGKYRKVLLNRLGAAIKDLTRPDVRPSPEPIKGGAK